MAFMFLVNLNAQENVKQESRQFCTPEQVAELQTKKMELDFDLNDKQRKDLYQLNLQNAQKRAQNIEKMKALKAENKILSSDERYQRRLTILDDQKKNQTEMKRILGEKQYLSWKETYQNKRMNFQHMNRNRKFAENNCRNYCRLNN